MFTNLQGCLHFTALFSFNPCKGQDVPLCTSENFLASVKWKKSTEILVCVIIYTRYLIYYLSLFLVNKINIFPKTIFGSMTLPHALKLLLEPQCCPNKKKRIDLFPAIKPSPKVIAPIPTLKPTPKPQSKMTLKPAPKVVATKPTPKPTPKRRWKPRRKKVTKCLKDNRSCKRDSDCCSLKCALSRHRSSKKKEFKTCSHSDKYSQKIWDPESGRNVDWIDDRVWNEFCD